MRRFATAPLSAPCFALPFSLAALLMPLRAQQPRPMQEVGTVSGHIQCGDTQRPARLANVRLVPTTITPTTGSKDQQFQQESAAFGNDLAPTETDLSGNFVMRNVKPGNYYVRVDYPGYLTPLLTFTSAQLTKPTPDIQQHIASDLQIITVAANATTRADVTLQHAASIRGTVRYDDGTPAPGIDILLFARNAKGAWENYGARHVSFWTNVSWLTDANGNFTLGNVPPGEYLVGAHFTMNTSTLTTTPFTSNGVTNIMQMMVQKTVFSITLYNGDVLRSRDGTAVKVDPGQVVDGLNLTMPLSKLHSISGTVLAKDGHVIRNATISLRYADAAAGEDEVAGGIIDAYDGQFHLPYVPEGNFTLTVTKARDTVETEVANPPGTTPRTHPEEKTVRTYSDASQPLSVQSDAEDVIVQVQESKATEATDAKPGN